MYMAMRFGHYTHACSIIQQGCRLPSFHRQFDEQPLLYIPSNPRAQIATDLSLWLQVCLAHSRTWNKCKPVLSFKWVLSYKHNILAFCVLLYVSFIGSLTFLHNIYTKSTIGCFLGMYADEHFQFPLVLDYYEKFFWKTLVIALLPIFTDTVLVLL